MKQEKSFAEELIETELSIMASKSKQYSSGQNPFQNFEEVADFLEADPLDIALIYMMKHIQAIALAIRTGKIEWCWVNEKGEEGLKQRFADARNYIMILGNMIDHDVQAANQEILY